MDDPTHPERLNSSLSREDMNIGDMQSDTSGRSTPEPRASTELSEPVASFFSNVTLGGFPEPDTKAQPWKRVWKGPQQPSSDGKILVGCPKICVYGSNVLGGY
ncbi:hypothetical protein ONS95_007436 [Cadophora gregata]|uniref:uncharacterized protein n=1 Tax=Cadophora gregata TaxID=51156 RepID=UPI0026DC1B88|nr:uncharacterized protein ONS95_007436 [Cadophora gregata]KAK0118548.1 hypothetical protein ONS96_011642 [Cadophora gregata f. sp. sojae]KAK0125804.1 hypothetical protein ONS95_007436 [Cadophora gregata]